MTLWYYGWMIVFFAATFGFAGIALIVVVRGCSDVAAMLRDLSQLRSRDQE